MLLKDIEKKIVLCIGGLDASGHAGLSADMRVATALGVHAASICTATTAQNSQAVMGIFAVDGNAFSGQWRAIVEDIEPSAIKVGLVANQDQLLLLASMLHESRQRWPQCPIILDPVGMTSTGYRLQSQSVARDFFQTLLPLVDWLTPNVLEWHELYKTFLSEAPSKTLWRDVHNFMALGLFPQLNLVVKGGHGLDDEVIDWWSNGQGQILGWSSERQSGEHLRATGCTFATALAAFLAQGYIAQDALTLTKMYLNEAIGCGYRVGRSSGPIGSANWPQNCAYLPRIIEPIHGCVPYVQQVSFPSILAKDLGLYPVVESCAWLERLLQWGVKTVQLRLKDVTVDVAEAQIQRAVQLGRHYQAQVFINDYWALAIDFGAYGVHLGQEDLQNADLSAIASAGLRLGISTHGYFEIAKAMAYQPSYIALGHIFPTQTKLMPSAPQGVERLKKYVELLKHHIPTVAIGGIGLAQMAAVCATHVDGVALVSAITKADQPETVVHQLQQFFEVQDA